MGKLAGKHELRYEFEVTGEPDLRKGRGTPGRGQLYIDGKLTGQLDMPYTVPLTLGLTAGIEAGVAHGSPIGDFWQPDFPFTGTLFKVVVDLTGELIKDDEAEARMLMARQ